MAEELKNLISGLQEAGVPVILERIETLEAKFGEIADEARDGRTSTDNRLDKIEQRVPAIFENMKTLESQLGEVQHEAHDASNGTNNRLDIILEYLSRGFFRRMFGKPNRGSSLG